MNIYRLDDELAHFTLKQASEIKVNGEYEWNLSVNPKVCIPKGTRFIITVQPFQHQLSEEYLQSYDFWKPNYIYALAEEESLGIDVSIKKVATNFSHINRWNDSSREAHITLEDDFEPGQEFFIQFGGVDRPWLRGDAPPSRVGIKAFNKDVCQIKKRLEVIMPYTDSKRTIDAFPPIRLVPGNVNSLSIYTPTLAQANTDFRIKMLAFDRFENPVPSFTPNNLTLVFENLDTGEKIRHENIAFKMQSYQLAAGRYLVSFDNTEMHVTNSIIKVENTVTSSIYWGDTHCHSNLTANIRDNDCGAFPQNAYQYAEQVSGLDFVGLSEQTFTFNEPSVNIDKATWEKIGYECNKYNRDREFITFCGFELHCKRGDTVTLFKEPLHKGNYPTGNVDIIHNIWNQYAENDFMTIPHLHRFCSGRSPKNVDNQDAKFEAGFDLTNWQPSSSNEPLVEVYSAQWGRFEYKKNPMLLKARNNVENNTVVDFLNRGKKWGFVSNSDGHDGNPGYGGITGVIADSLTRDDIFNAMQTRKTIATTHPRMYLDLQVNHHHIGEEANRAEKNSILIEALTTEPIDKVELIANGEVLEVWRVDAYKFDINLDHFTLDAGVDYLYVRVFQKDKHIGWTSPIWLK